MHEGQLRQSWQVWRHNNPLSHAEYHADLLLQQPHWHVTKDGLSLLQQVNRTGYRRLNDMRHGAASCV